MTSTLDPQSFALGCLLGGVVAFVLAGAIGGWLKRRNGPRGMIVRYLPRHPEDEVMEALLDTHRPSQFIGTTGPKKGRVQ